MGNITPAFVTVNPSFTEPGLIMPYFQQSGAFSALAEGKPLARLSEGDLVVYMKRIDLRTRIAAGQSAYNLLPSVETALSQLQTPTYLLRVRAEYDHHDTAAMARWGVNIVAAQSLGMRQAHFELARGALLYGFNPAGGEGLLNAVGATLVTLPDDTFGNDTVVTYDNGEMALFLLGQIVAMKTRTNQLGQGRRFVFVGPQRVFGQFEYTNIVQLTQYQRPGAGTATTAEMVKAICMANGDQVEWRYDDTLEGKGAGGTDAILLVMPEVNQPVGSAGGPNTNVFAELSPSIQGCSMMYCDMAAPREIPSPLAGGAIDIVSEWRISSGWAVRPEVVTVISMQYQ